MSIPSFPVGTQVEVLTDSHGWQKGVVVVRTTTEGLDATIVEHNVRITSTVIPSRHRMWIQASQVGDDCIRAAS